MKLHKYAEDALVKRLTDLSEKATPGPWEAVRSHHVQGTPVVMHWLKSPTDDYQGVSMGTGNDTDPQFISALVNAWREGRLYVVQEA